MQKITILATVLLAFPLFSYAQFDEITQESAIEVRKSAVVVLLDDPDPVIVKKLSKNNAELELYKAQIEGRNQALKRAMESCWIFNFNVEFKQVSEYKKEKKKSGYTLLRFEKPVDYEKIKTHSATEQPLGWSLAKVEKAGQGVTSYVYNLATKYTVLSNDVSILLLEGDDVMFSEYLPNPYPSEADLMYCIQQLQYCMRYYAASGNSSVAGLYKQIQKNISFLKKKTLLIDANDLEKAATVARIKSVYRYPFKVVSQDSINNVIASKDSMYAYIQMVSTPNETGSATTQFVCSPANGQIFYYSVQRRPAVVKDPASIPFKPRINLSDIRVIGRSIR
jgi:hypothetical protein